MPPTVPQTTITNARRNPGVLHRSAINSVDKLSVPSAPTLTAVTESGSTLANTAYYVTISAYNAWGPTGCPAPATITPSASQAIRAAFSQTTGATGYDIFLSTSATGPQWVGRITEAQRAAGGYIISTVGTVTSGGGAGAGAVDLGVVGTGLGSNVAPFLINNAYTPASPTAVNCAGYSRAHCLLQLAVTDLRSLPSVNVLPFFNNQVSTGNWHVGQIFTVAPLTAAGQPLQQDLEIDIDGSTSFVLLVDAIAGQGAALSCWVELA